MLERRQGVRRKDELRRGGEEGKRGDGGKGRRRRGERRREWRRGVRGNRGKETERRNIERGGE